MEEQRRRISSVPDLAEVEKERNRLKRRKEYGNALRGTCFSLLAVAAIAVLAATLFLPVLQVTGTSMETVRYRWKTSIQKDGKQQLRHWLFMLKKEKQKEPSPRIRLE